MSGVVSHEFQRKSKAHEHVHAAYAEERDLSSSVAVHRHQEPHPQHIHSDRAQTHSHHEHSHQLLRDPCEAVACYLQTGDHSAEQEHDASESHVAGFSVEQLGEDSCEQGKEAVEEQREGEGVEGLEVQEEPERLEEEHGHGNHHKEHEGGRVRGVEEHEVVHGCDYCVPGQEQGKPKS